MDLTPGSDISAIAELAPVVAGASVAATVELVRRAKAEGLAVTMEVTPQHLTLTDACCSGADPTFKVNPPSIW